jgi:hypothetical protein
MNTTARKATALIAGATVVLAALVITALLEQYDECEFCGRKVADLYDRLTEDGDEVRACEPCVHLHHLGYVAD